MDHRHLKIRRTDDLNHNYPEHKRKNRQGTRDADNSDAVPGEPYDRRPDQVELLFDTERPEVNQMSGCCGEPGRTDDLKRRIGSQGEVSHVDQEEEMTASPLIVEKRRQYREDRKHKVKDGKDTNAAASEKALEVMRIGASVIEDAGDQKTRQGEEKIDSDPSSEAQLIYQIEKYSSMGSASVMQSKNHDNRQSPNAIQGRKTRFEIDWSKITCWGAHLGSVYGDHLPLKIAIKQ